MHFKCRNDVYPGTDVKRFHVPDDKVSWKEPYNEYKPPDYTSPSVLDQPWADPDIGAIGFNPKWNHNDRIINRECGSHKYEIDIDGYPVNPVGRTGLKGRGVLGKWGPNNAGDCIVSRWKRTLDTNEIIYHDVSKKPILEFIAIRRKDCNEWAIPGGFADKSEHFMDTVRRELFEEAFNNKVGYFDCDSKKTFLGNDTDMGQFNTNDFVKMKLDEIFNNGTTVYSGYVDDRRNTDQAWISTTAVNFHDHLGTIFNCFQLEAGDDAGDAKWMEVNSTIELYANHKLFIFATTELLNSHY